MDEKCGFALCTSQFQQSSLEYQRLRSAKADLMKLRREAGMGSTTNEVLSTGSFALTLVFSRMDVRSVERLRGLHPLHRELCCIHTMQNSTRARDIYSLVSSPIQIFCSKPYNTRYTIMRTYYTRRGGKLTSLAVHTD